MRKQKVEILLQEQTPTGFRTVVRDENTVDFYDGVMEYYSERLGPIDGPDKRVWRLVLRHYKYQDGKRKAVYRVCGEFSIDMFMPNWKIRSIINGTDLPRPGKDPKIGK